MKRRARPSKPLAARRVAPTFAATVRAAFALTLRSTSALALRSGFALTLGVTLALTLGGTFAPGCAAAPASTTPSSTPADSAQAEARLAAVRERIAGLTERLAERLKERDASGARLREAELAVTAARRKLEGLKDAREETERRRAELQAESGREQRALDAQRAALAAQVRAAYMIGRQEPVKLLLSQSDPGAVGRMLTLYGYFVRSRGVKIDAVRGRLDRLGALLEEARQVAVQLDSLAAAATRETRDLDRARDDRAAALAALTREVGNGRQELARLRREEQAIEGLVVELADVLPDVPLSGARSFEDLRGKLPWPAAGRITASYRTAKDGTRPDGPRWDGIRIETSRGARVHASYFGRVVYADWLQGVGLLLIIGHSGGYMTLYGHAEVLYKSVGDWVAPGDVVAAMGDQPGAPSDLYFEIRDGRKTVDPRAWLGAAP